MEKVLYACKICLIERAKLCTMTICNPRALFAAGHRFGARPDRAGGVLSESCCQLLATFFGQPGPKIRPEISSVRFVYLNISDGIFNYNAASFRRQSYSSYALKAREKETLQYTDLFFSKFILKSMLFRSLLNFKADLSNHQKYCLASENTIPHSHPPHIHSA
jgi:hypothetical protein